MLRSAARRSAPGGVPGVSSREQYQGGQYGVSRDCLRAVRSEIVVQGEILGHVFDLNPDHFESAAPGERHSTIRECEFERRDSFQGAVGVVVDPGQIFEFADVAAVN